MTRKRLATLIVLIGVLPGTTGADRLVRRAPVEPAVRVAAVTDRTQPPRETEPNARGNGNGWLIPGLTAAGLAAWALSGHHAPPPRQPRPQSRSEAVPVVLTGTVTDDAGPPLASAAVELWSKTSGLQPARRIRALAQAGAGDYTPQAYVETDTNGRYAILSKLRDGAHRLVVSAVNHAVAEVSVDVSTAAQHVVQNVVLHQPGPAATPEPYEQRTIYYATDRAPEVRAARLDYANVARTAPGVAVGRATVSVAHSDTSSARFPAAAYTHVTRTAFGQAVVDDIAAPISAPSFSSALLAEAVRSRSRSIVIYIHGYNQSFDDAVRDATQFQYETGLDAPIVAYSWPSAHDLLKYVVDEESNSASVTNFVQFVGPLKAAATHSNIRIMIVAHSMGNRIAERAFEMLPDCVEAAVMAAPDVYSRVMSNGLSLVRKGVKHVTIYASQTDQALLLSSIFHDDPRVGLFKNDPFVATGMDTVDATAVDTSMLGHSYFIESTIVAADISRFLSGAGPSQRPNLAQKSVQSFSYWAIVQPH